MDKCCKNIDFDLVERFYVLKNKWEQVQSQIKIFEQRSYNQWQNNKLAQERKKYLKSNDKRYWTRNEHQIFVYCVNRLSATAVKGLNVQLISYMVGTRTVRQVRTHAQKYFKKLRDGRKMEVRSSPANDLDSKIITDIELDQKYNEYVESRYHNNNLSHLKNTAIPMIEATPGILPHSHGNLLDEDEEDDGVNYPFFHPTPNEPIKINRGNVKIWDIDSNQLPSCTPECY